MNCKHTKTKTIIFAEDENDIKQEICQACEFILKESVIISIDEGKTIEKRRAVKAPPLEKKPPEKKEIKTYAATDLASISVQAKENAIERERTQLVSQILALCLKEAKEGLFTATYTIKEGEYQGAVIVSAVTELKQLGYKTSKTAEPGVGTLITVKWGTQKKKSTAK